MFSQGNDMPKVGLFDEEIGTACPKLDTSQLDSDVADLNKINRDSISSQ